MSSATVPAPLPVTADLSAYHGDTWAQTFRLLDAADTPTNLAGATVAAWARTPAGDVETLVAAIVDETDGRVTIGFDDPPPDPGTYTYDVEVTAADGSVTTWVRGTLTVQRDVTRP